jgi:hypothetical protein
VRVLVPALLLFAACAEPGADEPSDETPDDKGDRGIATRGRFTEVDPSHSSKAFRSYIGKALDALSADPSDLAQMTLESIEDGKVKIDEMADLTCADFLHVIKDLPDLHLDPTDHAALKRRSNPTTAAIQAELDGYMWSNHVYVSRGIDARHLAATLIHEVNHVVNRSEVGYYDDLPTSAFLHEYRAFWVESQFEPEEYEGVNLVDFVIENYELDRSKIPKAILDQPLTPIFLPDHDAWRARDVEADVEEVADCSS